MALVPEPSNVVQFKPDTHVPPQNIDAEIAILGGIMLDPEAYLRVESLLRSEMFYVCAHGIIYKVMQYLAARSQPTDLIFVSNQLSDQDLLELVGGRSKLAAICSLTVSAVNIDRMAEIVRDKWVRRQMIQTGHKIRQLGFETETELSTVLDEAERLVFAISTDNTTADFRAKPCTDALLEIFQRLERGGEPPMLKTGLYDLDDIIGGLRQGDLDIVAARSGLGKTQLGVYLAYQVAVVYQQPVVFFSAEMSREKLLCRFLAIDSGIDSARLLNNKIHDCEWGSLSRAISTLSESSLRIDEHPNPSPSHLRAEVQRVKSEFGTVGLVVLDYLQLLGNAGGSVNRVQELDAITRACKSIAKEFDVPFLALAQISRAVEGRNNKRPLISDLRESGAIEQTADVVLLLYRDDYYNSDTPDRGLMEIIVGKNRDGSSGTAKLLFDPSLSRFRNLKS
jgi:replicative DNA helicase